jgi:hypothetical protein
MSARDYNVLSEIYNKRIFLKESYEEGIMDDPDARKVTNTRVVLPVPACDKCEEDDNDVLLTGDDHSDKQETNAYMAKQQCFRIAKMAAMLHELICDREELEPWIATKISQSFDDLNAVFAYKDYEQYREELEGSYDNVEEGTDKDLIDSINRGGSSIVNQIRRVVRSESKQNIEKVLLECVKALESK